MPDDRNDKQATWGGPNPALSDAPTATSDGSDFQHAPDTSEQRDPSGADLRVGDFGGSTFNTDVNSISPLPPAEATLPNDET